MTYPAIPNPKAIIAPYVALATSAIDVVGVYDQDFNQVISGARPVKAYVNREAKEFEHPLETGAVVTDFRIILQNRIEYYVILDRDDYANIYDQIEQLFVSGTLINVQTRTSVYSNMTVSAMPHEENSEIADTVQLLIKFKQTQYASTIVNTISPANASDGNTANRGNQQGSPSTDSEQKKSSTLLRFVKWVGT